MKQNVPVTEGKASISAPSSACKGFDCMPSIRTIRHTDTASSTTLMIPYIHGMDQSGNSTFTSSSPQRPEVTVAPLPKRDSISSWFRSLFVKAKPCARSPVKSAARNGVLLFLYALPMPSQSRSVSAGLLSSIKIPPPSQRFSIR